MNDWISVDDMLPLFGQAVIVEGGCAYRHEDDGWVSMMSDRPRVITWEVTHWMPLPTLAPESPK